MKGPRSIRTLSDVYGMRFLVRVSLDIPLTQAHAEEHFRVRKAIPTIAYLLKRGARVILLTHVGRDPSNTTLPLLDLLKKYFPIRHVNGVVGEEVFGRVAHMKEGTALLLENLRSHEGEENNDPEFARALASYGDFYINDAFAVSHRKHASIVGIPQYLPNFAGITFGEEYEALRKVFTPQDPSLFVLGGVKFETKVPLVQKYVQHYTNIFIGGGNANDFLKAKGYEVGESLLSGIDLTKSPLIDEERILLPKDVIVANDGKKREAACDDVKQDEKILDVGPQSITMLSSYINNAKTILWNGPLGHYEAGHDTATKEVAKLIAQSKAFSVVGGGDTVAAIGSLGLEQSFGFLSTAGGAMLEFLEKQTLPGIEALTKEV